MSGKKSYYLSEQLQQSFSCNIQLIPTVYKAGSACSMWLKLPVCRPLKNGRVDYCWPQFLQYWPKENLWGHWFLLRRSAVYTNIAYTAIQHCLENSTINITYGTYFVAQEDNIQEKAQIVHNSLYIALCINCLKKLENSGLLLVFLVAVFITITSRGQQAILKEIRMNPKVTARELQKALETHLQAGMVQHFSLTLCKS